MRIVIAALASVMLLTGSVTPSAAQDAAAPAAPQILTFDGEVALLTVAIKADKTADFEAIMQRMRDALLKSEDPKRRQQAEGWKVMRLTQPLPDGTVAYIHVINPVVPGVDYTIMQTLYDAFPEERQALYDMFRGAFVKNLSLAVGTIAVDVAKP